MADSAASTSAKMRLADGRVDRGSGEAVPVPSPADRSEAALGPRAGGGWGPVTRAGAGTGG